MRVIITNRAGDDRCFDRVLSMAYEANGLILKLRMQDYSEIHLPVADIVIMSVGQKSLGERE